VQRFWRRFAAQHQPTSRLAHAFAAQGVANTEQQQEQETDAEAAVQEAEVPQAGGFVMIGGVGSLKTSSKHECFEDFAKKLQSPTTLKTAQVRRGGMCGVVGATCCFL
jgi:hypothetical protein